MQSGRYIVPQKEEVAEDSSLEVETNAAKKNSFVYLVRPLFPSGKANLNFSARPVF
ncbi:MAG: hypothetical protein CM1200mP16_14510 [Nitrospina sp.]|nr:MAG: hypothetical protein CM1200mP16_14510 [Nitrospina sp.]